MVCEEYTLHRGYYNAAVEYRSRDDKGFVLSWFESEEPRVLVCVHCGYNVATEGILDGGKDYIERTVTIGNSR